MIPRPGKALKSGGIQVRSLPGPELLNFANSMAKRLVDRIAMAVRTVGRRREAARHGKLYGNLPARTMPVPLDHAGQVTKLGAIVKAHCTSGDAIVAAHDMAMLKLDAAEYALSSLLAELRGVVEKMPTDWSPQRTPPLVPVTTRPVTEVRAA